MRKIRCGVCGKFIGFKEFDNNEIKTEYTPDSYYTVEKIEHNHKRCIN